MRLPRASTELSHMKAYRSIFYSKYQSQFKRRAREHFDYSFTDQKLIPLIEPWLSQSDRAGACLDLGCGDGSLLHALHSLGFEKLYGVDASGEQIELAKQVTPQVSVGDLFEYLAGFEDEFFEVVTLFDVIEHLTKEEIVRCVGLIRQKLRKGGLWICHLPNGDSPFVGCIQFGDFTHETMLSPASARNLCGVFGFDEFDASEHLGCSAGAAGMVRSVGWRGLRLLPLVWNLIETGSAGTGILTRNFAFKARKPA